VETPVRVEQQHDPKSKTKVRSFETEQFDFKRRSIIIEEVCEDKEIDSDDAGVILSSPKSEESDQFARRISESGKIRKPLAESMDSLQIQNKITRSLTKHSKKYR